jgi:hypothetical protein
MHELENEPLELTDYTTQLKSLVTDSDYEEILLSSIVGNKTVKVLSEKLNEYYADSEIKFTESVFDSAVQARATPEMFEMMLRLMLKNKPKTKFELLAYQPKNIKNGAFVRKPVPYPDYLYEDFTYYFLGFDDYTSFFQADKLFFRYRDRSERFKFIDIILVNDYEIRIKVSYNKTHTSAKFPLKPKKINLTNTATNVNMSLFIVIGYLYFNFFEFVSVTNSKAKIYETQTWRVKFDDPVAENLHFLITHQEPENVSMGFQLIQSQKQPQD